MQIVHARSTSSSNLRWVSMLAQSKAAVANFLKESSGVAYAVTFAGPAKRIWGAIPTTRFGKAIVRTRRSSSRSLGC